MQVIAKLQVVRTLDEKQHVGTTSIWMMARYFPFGNGYSWPRGQLFGHLGGNVITVGRYVLQSGRKFPNCNKPVNGNSLIRETGVPPLKSVPLKFLNLIKQFPSRSTVSRTNQSKHYHTPLKNVQINQRKDVNITKHYM